jgi:hypothetical protein
MGPHGSIPALQSAQPGADVNTAGWCPPPLFLEARLPYTYTGTNTTQLEPVHFMGSALVCIIDARESVNTQDRHPFLNW